jgi:hypothetical protein
MEVVEAVKHLAAFSAAMSSADGVFFHDIEGFLAQSSIHDKKTLTHVLKSGHVLVIDLTAVRPKRS